MDRRTLLAGSASVAAAAALPAIAIEVAPVARPWPPFPPGIPQRSLNGFLYGFVQDDGRFVPNPRMIERDGDGDILTTEWMRTHKLRMSDGGYTQYVGSDKMSPEFEERFWRPFRHPGRYDPDSPHYAGRETYKGPM